MACCVFFGHKDADQSIREELKNQIQLLITVNETTIFYVGNNGGFDSMVYGILKELKQEYTNIDYYVTLAYLPVKKTEFECKFYKDVETFLPDGIEIGPQRFAIDRRNRWMIDQADYVITHVKHSWGGAAKFKELAEKKGKQVINII